MGSIQKYKGDRWNVQIRHQGYRSVSKVFSSLETAQAFHDKIELAILKDMEKDLVDQAEYHIRKS